MLIWTRTYSILQILLYAADFLDIVSNVVYTYYIAPDSFVLVTANVFLCIDILLLNTFSYYWMSGIRDALFNLSEQEKECNLVFSDGDSRYANA